MNLLMMKAKREEGPLIKVAEEAGAGIPGRRHMGRVAMALPRAAKDRPPPGRVNQHGRVTGGLTRGGHKVLQVEGPKTAVAHQVLDAPGI